MSHEPVPHGSPPPGPSADERLGSVLARAQFLVTGLILAVVATLAYVAGMHSAKGGGHGGESAGTAPATVDVSGLLKPTPDLLAKGKNVFMINCASCHGTAGRGDGPASAALNPKPRNFTEGYWRYGGGIARVVRTITQGSPGTAMASFSILPIEDRIAAAHYVRSLSPKPEEDKPEDLAWLVPPGHPQGGGGVAESTGVAAGTAPPGPVIPIEKAMAALAEAEPPVGSAAPAAEPGPGADLFAQRCAACHGASGQGGVRVRMLGSAPYAYVATGSLGAARGDWTTSSAAFERLVVAGLPGFVMPANGDLSRDELRDLYVYTQKLRARQELAARPGS